MISFRVKSISTKNNGNHENTVNYDRYGNNGYHENNGNYGRNGNHENNGKNSENGNVGGDGVCVGGVDVYVTNKYSGMIKVERNDSVWQSLSQSLSNTSHGNSIDINPTDSQVRTYVRACNQNHLKDMKIHIFLQLNYCLSKKKINSTYFFLRISSFTKTF